jgi:hypothetical protein
MVFFFFLLNIGKGIFRDTQNAIDGPTMARPTGIFFMDSIAAGGDRASTL